MKYVIKHVAEDEGQFGETWITSVNGKIDGVFWFEKDAYDWVAKQVHHHAFILNNYEVDP